jgi:hypothetical protein
VFFFFSSIWSGHRCCRRQKSRLPVPCEASINTWWCFFLVTCLPHSYRKFKLLLLLLFDYRNFPSHRSRVVWAAVATAVCRYVKQTRRVIRTNIIRISVAKRRGKQPFTDVVACRSCRVNITPQRPE